MSGLMDISEKNFESEVLQSKLPFLLDLSAEWCQPCKAIEPLVHQLASEYEGRVRFGRVDIDSDPQIPTRYQVRSVPTLLMFQGGDVVGQLVGSHPKDRIADLINKGL